ncbi:MAG TPA: hypothetical protein VGA78_02180 [Gemmatimonadales bacterium]|jgi:hypothetical protein
MRDTISVALPASDASRFLVAHLTDSASVDCEGHPISTRRGGYRLGSSNPTILLSSDSTAPVILLHDIQPGTDPRDLIDRRVDLVITADPVTLDYARTQRDLRLVPLAWSVTYTLVSSPGQAPPLEPSDGFRAELAHDAVRAEARPAERPERRDVEGGCTVQSPRPAVRLPDIAIPRNDPIARALAERLVAVAAPSGPRRVTALPPAGLDSALTHGTAMAYIVPLSRVRPTECAGTYPLPRGSSLFPLIDVRATAVLRPGVPPFFIEGDGTIRFPSRQP